jgi:hypothetical protein
MNGGDDVNDPDIEPIEPRCDVLNAILTVFSRYIDDLDNPIVRKFEAWAHSIGNSALKSEESRSTKETPLTSFFQREYIV